MLAQLVAAKHNKIMQDFTEICWEESIAPPSPTTPCLQGMDIPAAPASPSNLWEYFQAIHSTESFDASQNDPKPSSKKYSRCRKRRRERDNAVAPQLPTEVLDKNQAWGSVSSPSDESASQNPKQLSKDQRYRRRRKEKELSKDEEIASLKRQIEMLRKENSSLKICLQVRTVYP